jgi:hypothetical protein
MTYHDVAAAAADNQLRLRVAGCIATLDDNDIPEAMYAMAGRHPVAIADNIMWNVAGDSTISDAYAYGVATDVPNPGDDPAVVTDAMILTAVQDAIGITP